MATGPGKYDALATQVREQAKARGVAVIVFAGHLGSGFSVQGDELMMERLPWLMRAMADDIEKDMAGFPQPQRNDGGAPCGECHLRQGETCDVCGAVRNVG